MLPIRVNICLTEHYISLGGNAIRTCKASIKPLQPTLFISNLNNTLLYRVMQFRHRQACSEKYPLADKCRSPASRLPHRCCCLKERKQMSSLWEQTQDFTTLSGINCRPSTNITAPIDRPLLRLQVGEIGVLLVWTYQQVIRPKYKTFTARAHWYFCAS